MAHSWVMAHDDELTAFTRYYAVHGPRSVLLIDTYDTLAAARRIVSAGLRPAAVRVDSGDLAGLSGAVRGIFDGGGLRQTKIFVSGDLDEHRIDTLIAAGAPIDGFGVGTAVTTSADAPSLSGVYKLVEVVRNGTTVPVAKLTPGKRTLPGAKQVWRVSEAGKARRDVMGMSDESGPPQGTPLLRRVMRDGRLTDPSSPLDAIRDRCRYEVAALPAGVRRLLDAERFPVELSAALGRLSRRVSGPRRPPSLDLLHSPGLGDPVRSRESSDPSRVATPLGPQRPARRCSMASSTVSALPRRTRSTPSESGVAPGLSSTVNAPRCRAC